MTWALELRAMPNKQTGGLKVLAGWVVAGCLSVGAPVLAQVADQEPDAGLTSDSEDVTPATTASDEVAAPLEPEAPTAPAPSSITSPQSPYPKTCPCLFQWTSDPRRSP